MERTARVAMRYLVGFHLTDEQVEYLDDLVERLGQRYKTSKVCFQISEAIRKRFGWPVVSGRFRGEGHYWNVLPDGSILDASYDQFDEDAAPIAVWSPRDPEHAEYRIG